MSLPTTRRGRWIIRYYQQKVRNHKWRSKRWRWRHYDPMHHNKWVKFPRLDIVDRHPRPPLQLKVHQAKEIFYTTPTKPFVLVKGGRGKFTRAVLVFPYTPPFTDPDWHLQFGLTGWYFRNLPYVPRHVKTRRRTKRERQITGCNWFYFRNGFYKNDDVLGRRPNADDVFLNVFLVNGPGFWPSPLGY